MSGLIDLFLNLDKHVEGLAQTYGAWAYAILFGVIFAETGLVVMPFLPGDSLLFMLGIFSRPERNAFDPWALFFLLSLAAIIGDQVNYRLGNIFGERLFKSDSSKVFKRSHLLKTQEFYAKHGPKTVMLARFVPIVRTLAPFVAGMGRMSYMTFTTYSIAGAFVWVGVCVWAGYFFGAIPAVQKHFELGILAIVGISVVPMAIEVIKHKRAKKRLTEATTPHPSNEAAASEVKSSS